MSKFAASAEHTAAVNQLIPGGAHTYARGDDQYPEGMAPVIERGAGCRVWDIDGNEFVEFGSGLRANTLGHGFEPVVRAVQRYLADGVGFVRPHRLEREAAERLIDLIPSAEMVKFGVNGSDATSGAVKLARAYTGRDMVAVCRQHPFFSTDDWFIVTTPMSAGIPESVRPLTVQFDYNDLASLEALFEAHPGQIAAVVLEAETVEPPAPGFFAGLRQLCDRNGALLRAMSAQGSGPGEALPGADVLFLGGDTALVVDPRNNRALLLNGALRPLATLASQFLLQPLLTPRYAGLPAVYSGLSQLQSLLEQEKLHSGWWVPVSALPAATRQAIDAACGQVLQELAPIASITEPRNTANAF